MKNKTTESAKDLDVQPSQAFLNNGPFIARNILGGLYRDLLTECPLTAITNIATVPYLYNIGIAFYVPDGSSTPKIQFYLPENSTTLHVVISYKPSISATYTLYDFHHLHSTETTKVDILKVNFSDHELSANLDFGATDPNRGTHTVIQYSE